MSLNKHPFDSPSRESDVPLRPSRLTAEAGDIHFPPISPIPPIPPIHPISTAAASTAAPLSLPSLPSLSSQDSKDHSYPTPRQTAVHWPSVNPLAAYYTPGYVQTGDKTDADASSTSTGTAGAMSPECFIDGRASSVSLDDPDVRLAAEALGDLRADFVSSPPHTASAPSKSPSTSEPLLSLLTTSHPLLARTIEGTTSAYNSSKNFSPRFKSSAEYVEGYLTPIGNTLGSVSRVTGVENGVRWFLKGGQRHLRTGPPDPEAGSGQNNYKRRRLDLESNGQRSGSPSTAVAWKGAHPDVLVFEGNSDMDAFGFAEERRQSMSTVETLPAYDEQKSPAYTESAENSRPLETEREGSGSGPRQRGFPPAAWQSRLIMSTSGLSIAMSEESLRSLKYCLHWLRWANEHIGATINALKSTLEQFESAEASRLESVVSAGHAQTPVPSPNNATDRESPERSELAARITAMRSDVLQTLRGVIDTVSKYAGGALPDNARDLVRRHLTSLPQRFRLANHTDAAMSEAGVEAGVEAGGDTGGEARREARGRARNTASGNELKENAQRVLVLAREGLDMMAQVSGVLDGTIVSAEEWCERLGKKKREERSRHSTDADLATKAVSGQDNGAVDIVMQ